MKVIWDYNDCKETSTVTIGVKSVGIRKNNYRPNKVIIGFQEYQDFIKQLGEKRALNYIYSHLVKTLNPMDRYIIIEITDTRKVDR